MGCPLLLRACMGCPLLLRVPAHDALDSTEARPSATHGSGPSETPSQSKWLRFIEPHKQPRVVSREAAAAAAMLLPRRRPGSAEWVWGACPLARHCRTAGRSGNLRPTREAAEAVVVVAAAYMGGGGGRTAPGHIRQGRVRVRDEFDTKT